MPTDPVTALVRQFPEGFVWGSSTSSHQIEGAWLEGGKGLSIWDVFSHTPGKILNGDTADVATDHYHRFREDVALMANMGLSAYRFSIAWPRIQPAGYGAPNEKGLRFYSDLIDELLVHGITPWVTLYHWDLPAALQFEHDGWLNPRMADFFAEYARLCFEAFGDRVKHWITFNEPWVAAMLGYGQGVFAPGRVSSIEPYRAGHEMLRAHGRVVDLYRREYRHRAAARVDGGAPGVIGMSNNCDWREPASATPADRAAAERALEFYLGWFADPIYFGDYPASMRERLGERLPRFSEEDAALIKGSNDFFGLNHYTTMLCAHSQGGANQAGTFGNAGIAEDQDVAIWPDPAWPMTEMGWPIVPWGCRKLLEWIDRRYGSPDIVMTENGCAVDDHVADGGVNDEARIAFLEGYLTECHHAIQNGVRLKGYFVWSLLDNFEWALGYSKRFGIHYVDYDSGRRIPKASARWYREVMARNGLVRAETAPVTPL